MSRGSRKQQQEQIAVTSITSCGDEPALAASDINGAPIITISEGATGITSSSAKYRVAANAINTSDSEKDLTSYESTTSYGALPKTITVKKGDIIFPRLDIAKELAELAE